MTYLFYNWKFVHFHAPSLIFPAPHPLSLATTYLFSVSVSFFLCSTYKWDHTELPFCVWLLPLSIMASRSIHVNKNSKASFFLWLNYIFIHSSISGCLSFIHVLGIINNAAINMRVQCTYLFRLVFLFSSGKYTEAELLNHVAHVFSVF